MLSFIITYYKMNAKISKKKINYLFIYFVKRSLKVRFLVKSLV